LCYYHVENGLVIGWFEMIKEKWKRINVLSELISKIESLVEEGKYSTIPNFIDIAIREKLAKENGGAI